MVHILPCAFPEDQHKVVPRKRKIAHSEEISSTFLTPMVSQGSIILTPNPEDSQYEGRNYNFNNSSPFWRTFLNLKQSGRVSPGGSVSSSPSPIALLERKLSGDGAPSSKRIATELLPKVGRPRSKSITTDKLKKKTPKSSSKGSEQAKNAAQGLSNTFTPITLDSTSLNSNTNNNNVSPPGNGVLTIPVTQFRPLPITPPRNPFEDQSVSNRHLDPKTLRHLQRKLA